MNTATRLAAALTAAAATLAVAACQSTPPPPAVQADDVTVYPRVTATDGLARILRVPEQGVNIEHGDNMTVSIPVRSISPTPEFLQYRFIFFEGGRPLDTTPAWRRARVEAQGLAYLEATSLEPADDFQLEIRASR